MLDLRGSKLNRKTIIPFVCVCVSYSLMEKTDQKTNNYNKTRKEMLVAGSGREMHELL